MILALDMGNTNIVIGCIDSQKTYFVERVTTDHAKTGTEYAINKEYSGDPPDRPVRD